MLSRIRAWAANVSPGVWLAAIVVISSVVWAAVSHRVVAPWIMTDELTYAELARSFADHGHFLIRGVTANNYGFVYPLVIAPAWAIFGTAADAYQASKVIDSVIMSLAAIPAYFLARKLVRPNLALLAAGLTVLVPGMLYTGTLMTETVFYPVFLAAALALYDVLDHPSRRNQVVLLAVCVFAYLTRAQAVALIAAAVLAPVVLVLIDRRPFWRGLRPFLTLYGILATGFVLAVLAALARGGRPSSLLGAYRKTLSSDYTVHDVLHYLLWHAAGLSLAMGVIPAVALFAMWFGPRSISHPARVFVAMTLPLTVLLVGEVAAFASTQAHRMEERNMFYLVPFGIIALVAALGDGAISKGWLPRGAAAALAVIPVAFIPYTNQNFIGPPAVSDTFALLPWWWAQDHWMEVGHVWIAVLIASIVAAALFLFVPRRLIAVLPVVVGFYFVLTAVIVNNGRHGMHNASLASSYAGQHRAPHDWIQQAIGRSAPVAYLWSGAADQHTVWENEFFNRNPAKVYTLIPGQPDPLPNTVVTRAANGRLLADGKPVYAPYVLSDGTTAIKGEPVTADLDLGLTLYRVKEPVILPVHVAGLYPGDTWSGKTVTYTRQYCTGGHLTVILGSDPTIFDSDQVVTAVENGRAVATVNVAPDRLVKLRVTLHPVNGLCRVRYVMGRTVVPTSVDPTSNDPRPLGAHFTTFGYTP